jgi:hypothetical protein
LLLVANRYAPFGLLLLGPVIVNILGFHTFMSTTNLPLALLVTALWLIVFFRVRRAFSGVFVERVPWGKVDGFSVTEMCQNPICFGGWG